MKISGRGRQTVNEQRWSWDGMYSMIRFSSLCVHKCAHICVYLYMCMFSPPLHVQSAKIYREANIGGLCGGNVRFLKFLSVI